MNIKQTSMTATLIAFLSCFSLVNAEPSGSIELSKAKSNVVIVTVSGQKVMMESETGKAIQARLQEKQKELATPLQNEEKKIRDKEQKILKEKENLDHDVAEFEKGAKALSAESRNQKFEQLQERAQRLEDDKRELDRLVQKLQAEGRKVEAKLSELYQKEMGKFEALVKETIKDLAQRFNWDIVLMEESVVYAHPTVSKTKEVVGELDKRAKAASQAKKQALEKEASGNKTTEVADAERELKKLKTDLA